MLLIVLLPLEAQSHALVALTGLPVAVRLVEISYGEGSACTLRVQWSRASCASIPGRPTPGL